MISHKLGSSTLELTPVGLGTWAMGGAGWQFSWGAQDDEQSIRAIEKAIELGVNWIDTAPAYGRGHAEEIVGKALRRLSVKPVVATKCGRLFDTDGRIYSNLRKKSIFQEADQSLKRLGLDVIDLYQIHWPFPKEQIEEGWDAVCSLIEAGKVRFGGVSNFSPEQIKRIQPIGAVASLQPPYSMLERRIEKNTLPYCQTENIGVIVYSPMQKGLLSGKMTRERIERLDPEDHRLRDPMFQDPELAVNLDLIAGLSEMAGRSGHTLSHLAIAWVLRNPAVTAAIVGARSPEQIAETVHAAEWRLSDQEAGEIEALLAERVNRLRDMKSEQE
ncbi:aldo/keto reductase [bacterium]|nr:aldo/keto reductase [bacterium]